MKVHLIKRQTIEDYIACHEPGRSSFAGWLTALKRAEWDKPDDIKQTFGSVDIIGCGSNRVVFNIGGNNYRMICKYHFGNQKVHLFVCWIGTHTEYDELCDTNTQYIINTT